LPDERDPAEAARRKMGRRHPARHDGCRQKGVERQAQPEACAEDPVKPVVSVDRDPDRDGRGDQRDEGFVPAEYSIEPSRHQHRIRDVEADEGKQRSK
jgi:hypothetical protein